MRVTVKKQRKKIQDAVEFMNFTQHLFGIQKTVIENGSVVRPLRQLKGFQKVELEPGMFRVYLGNSSETDNAADFVLSSDASFIF